MKVIEPNEKSRLVRAGSLRQESAFRDHENGYFVVLDMQDGYFESKIRPSCEVDYNPIWVFNVKSDTLGIFDEDEMVEPVELEINVKGKE